MKRPAKQKAERARAFTLAVLGPFFGRNMPVFAGCATLFLLTASFPLLIWVLAAVNHLPGYSTADVADLLCQFLPQVPEIQDTVLDALNALRRPVHHLCGLFCRRDHAVFRFQRHGSHTERAAAADPGGPGSPFTTGCWRWRTPSCSWGCCWRSCCCRGCAPSSGR